MSNFIRFLLLIFDKRNDIKLRNFFFNTFGKNIDVIIDVGAHHGEKIKFFLKYFNVNKIFAFEASPINFNILKKKKFINSSRVEIYCLAVGPKNYTTFLNQTVESSSSTLVKINTNSKYFVKKKKY